MRFSALTDEIADTFEQALDICQDLGIDTVELRKVGEQNIVFHERESLLQIQHLLQQRSMRVQCIASPFLKSPLWQTVDQQNQEWKIFERSLEIAELFDAPLVRTFSFLRAPDPLSVRPQVVEAIAEAVHRVERAGRKLVIENEHACNIATGAETGWLFEQIPSPAFGVTWDPGNEAAVGSSPYPEGYRHVRGRIFNVHLKDIDAQRHWVKIGDGIIDYVGQFRALIEDGYDGTIALEPHYAHPDGGREQAARESFAAIREMLRAVGAEL